MAETSAESGDIVVKIENDNKDTTEDKDTKNVSQSNELSKSENDSATSENTMKNTNEIIEVSLEGNDEKNDKGKKLVSDNC